MSSLDCYHPLSTLNTLALQTSFYWKRLKKEFSGISTLTTVGMPLAWMFLACLKKSDSSYKLIVTSYCCLICSDGCRNKLAFELAEWNRDIMCSRTKFIPVTLNF